MPSKLLAIQTILGTDDFGCSSDLSQALICVSTLLLFISTNRSSTLVSKGTVSPASTLHPRYKNGSIKLFLPTRSTTWLCLFAIFVLQIAILFTCKDFFEVHCVDRT